MIWEYSQKSINSSAQVEMVPTYKADEESSALMQKMLDMFDTMTTYRKSGTTGKLYKNSLSSYFR